MNPWIALAAAALLILPAVSVLAFIGYLLLRHGREFQRFFETPPALVAPQADPLPGDEYQFSSAAGRMLVGNYLQHRGETCRGMIVFCHEFTGTRRLALRYADFLLDAGFDLFAFDFCNHGDSDSVPGYQPMQWVTEHEVSDVNSAIEYVNSNFPSARCGLGLFGISKGGSAGVVNVSRNSLAQAVVIDGAYPTHSVVAQFAQRWVHLVAPLGAALKLLPVTAFGLLTSIELKRIGRRRKCQFPRVERSLRSLTRRPLMVIHGKQDRYISADIVKKVFSFGRSPREFWLVPKAKHNQCLDVAGDEYRRNVTEFFCTHLSTESPDFERKMQQSGRCNGD